jgi:hypothetical protein
MNLLKTLGSSTKVYESIGQTVESICEAQKSLLRSLDSSKALTGTFLQAGLEAGLLSKNLSAAAGITASSLRETYSGLTLGLTSNLTRNLKSSLTPIEEGLLSGGLASNVGLVQAVKGLKSTEGGFPFFPKVHWDDLLPSIGNASSSWMALRESAFVGPALSSRISAMVNASSGFSRWIAENTPPPKPQLTRGPSGRPNYIEYVRELKEAPRHGLFGLSVLFWEWEEGVGTSKGDLLLLSDERANSEARYYAAKRFVLRYIRLRLASPTEDHALKRMIRETSEDELLGIRLPGLVLEAVDECDKPQRIRVGKKWVKGRSGRAKLVRPVLLPHGDYQSWLRQRVYKRLGEMVRTEYSFDHSCDPNELEDLASQSFLDALSAAEAYKKEQRLPWSEELEKMPKAQRRYARTLLEVLAEEDDIAVARRKTARRLKISAGNERVIFSRLSSRSKTQHPQKRFQLPQ